MTVVQSFRVGIHREIGLRKNGTTDETFLSEDSVREKARETVSAKTVTEFGTIIVAKLL